MTKVIIIGAGPAGIFACRELIKNPNLEVVLIEQGNLIENRTPNEIMNGFGGAGTFSDGKLHFTPVLSHEKLLHLYNLDEYQQLLDYVEQLFLDAGVEPDYYPKDLDKTNALVETAEKNNIKLFIRKALHVGSDKLPAIMKTFQDELTTGGVKIMDQAKVEELIIKDGIIKGVLVNGQSIETDYVICAPGRYNAEWLQSISDKYSIPYEYDKIEVGVRVEFPSSVIRNYAELMYETIFFIYTKSYDDVVRTFCPCPHGHVATEEYEDFVCVNGHSNSNLDGTNSNFALVTEITLTEPLENTHEYAKHIAQGTTLLGGGKPLIQRLKDLKQGRRSTPARIERAHIIPSLKEAVPGDISMALPYRVITNLIEGIEQLDKILPGLNGDSTFFYAPEIKLRGTKIKTNKHLETNITNLYVAGDAAGLSGNIIGAAICGVITGKHIATSNSIINELK